MYISINSCQCQFKFVKLLFVEYFFTCIRRKEIKLLHPLKETLIASSLQADMDSSLAVLQIPIPTLMTKADNTILPAVDNFFSVLSISCGFA